MAIFIWLTFDFNLTLIHRKTRAPRSHCKMHWHFHRVSLSIFAKLREGKFLISGYPLNGHTSDRDQSSRSTGGAARPLPPKTCESSHVVMATTIEDDDVHLSTFPLIINCCPFSIFIQNKSLMPIATNIPFVSKLNVDR